MCFGVKKILTNLSVSGDKILLTSLKVLPGTRMRLEAKNRGLKFSPLPPYEVLETPEMSAFDLRKAMQISRTIDLYYNSEAWQKLFRELICQDEGFLEEFTGHLADMMVLDTPVSLERRGIILYDYCRAHCPEKVTAVSVAWIEAGFSLKKEPAGNIVKIKHMDTYLSENNLEIRIEYGQLDPTQRYYLYTSEEEKIIFGYDSRTHLPAPTFKATAKP